MNKFIKSFSTLFFVAMGALSSVNAEALISGGAPYRGNGKWQESDFKVDYMQVQLLSNPAVRGIWFYATGFDGTSSGWVLMNRTNSDCLEKAAHVQYKRVVENNKNIYLSVYGLGAHYNGIYEVDGYTCTIREVVELVNEQEKSSSKNTKKSNSRNANIRGKAKR